MRFGFLVSAALLIFVHNSSGSSARGVLKGLILAKSQPIGVFHQAGIGTLNNFPRIVVRQSHQFQNLFAIHPIFREDSLLCPNDHIDQWDFAFVTDEKVQWEVILRHILICAKRLPIFAQVGDFFFIHHQFQIGHFITPWQLSDSADGILGIGGSQTLVFHATVRGFCWWSSLPISACIQAGLDGGSDTS